MSVARGSGTTHNTDKAGASQTGLEFAIERRRLGGGGPLRELSDWGMASGVEMEWAARGRVIRGKPNSRRNDGDCEEI